MLLNNSGASKTLKKLKEKKYLENSEYDALQHKTRAKTAQTMAYSENYMYVKKKSCKLSRQLHNVKTIIKKL